MFKESVVDTIEKVFRYFIPGFIFIFLFKLAFPSKPHFILDNIGKVEFYIFIPCLGMIIYGLHRVFLSAIIEPFLYKLNKTAISNFAGPKRMFKEYPSALAKFLEIRHKAEEKLSSYLFYRWSIQHYSLILCELTLIFLFIHEQKSIFEIHRCWIGIFLIITIISSSLLTYIMYGVEKNLFGQKEAK